MDTEKRKSSSDWRALIRHARTELRIRAFTSRIISASWRTLYLPCSPVLIFELVFRFEVKILFEVRAVGSCPNARAARQVRFEGEEQPLFRMSLA